MPSGIEVNVFVAAGTGLVASLFKCLGSIYIVKIICCSSCHLEDGVPAGVLTIIPFDLHSVFLPKPDQTI